MSFKLGLIDKKEDFTDEVINIEPKTDVTSICTLYNAVKVIFNDLQSQYKFTEVATGKRLKPSFALRSRLNTWYMSWIFKDDKRVVSEIIQKLYTFELNGQVTLKLASNDNIIEDLITLSKDVKIEQLLKAPKVEVPKVVEVKEDVIKDEKPLDQVRLTTCDEQNFLENGMFLAGIDLEELLPKEDTESTSESKDAPILKETSKEETNATGKKIFEDHKIHDILIKNTDLITKYFQPFVIVNKADSASIRQSSFVAEDIQKIFENDYAEVISKKGETPVKIYPITHMNGDNNRFVLRNFTTNEFIHLSNPKNFYVTLSLVTSVDKTTEHKVTVTFSENDLVTASLIELRDLFLKEFTKDPVEPSVDYQHLKPSPAAVLASQVSTVKPEPAKPKPRGRLPFI